MMEQKNVMEHKKEATEHSDGSKRWEESGHDPSQQQQKYIFLVIIKNHLNEMLNLLLRFDSLNRLSSLELECDSAVVLKLKVCPVLT